MSAEPSWGTVVLGWGTCKACGAVSVRGRVLGQLIEVCGSCGHEQAGRARRDDSFEAAALKRKKERRRG